MTHDPYRTPRPSRNSTWGWLAGIAAILILGFIVWSAMDSNTDTASTDRPATTQSTPSTTGAAPNPTGTPTPVTPGRETKGSAQ